MALNELKNDPKAQARCVSLINGEAIRLEQMVGDVLSVAEVESGSLRLKRDDVRLDELLHDIQAAYGAQAEEKQIKLTFDLAPKLPVLHGDRGKIAQAMHNLVGNALKYTPKKGKVHVAASVADGQFVMEVKDTGIGIAEKDCQRVFERFYRAKSKAVSQIQGSGLGLTIAREIARLHGGDISLVSKLKEGSTFTLRLPAPEESA
jgi:signal transduction histidine kinase